MSTLLITHPSFLAHNTGPHHPERADRLRAVLAALDGRGVLGPQAHRGAARHAAGAGARSSGGICPRHPRYQAGRGRAGDDRRRHGDERGQRRGDPARRRCADRRRRCGDERIGAQCLRRGAAARPSRHARHAGRLLPVQQRGDRRAPCPGQARRRPRRHPRFRRASRPGHAGRGRARPLAVLRLDAPISALSRHRLRRASAASTTMSPTCRSSPTAAARSSAWPGASASCRRSTASGPSW